MLNSSMSRSSVVHASILYYWLHRLTGSCSFQGDAQQSQVLPSRCGCITTNLSPSRLRPASLPALPSRDPEPPYARLNTQVLYQYDLPKPFDQHTNKNDTTHKEQIRRLEATASGLDINLPAYLQERLSRDSKTMAPLQLLEAPCQINSTSRAPDFQKNHHLIHQVIPQQTPHSSSSLRNQATESSHFLEEHESPDIELQTFRPGEDTARFESDLIGIGEQFHSYTVAETTQHLCISGEVSGADSEGNDSSRDVVLGSVWNAEIPGSCR